MKVILTTNIKKIGKVGDLVKVMESRPMSKHKNWLLKEVVLESSEPV